MTIRIKTQERVFLNSRENLAANEDQLASVNKSPIIEKKKYTIINVTMTSIGSVPRLLFAHVKNVFTYHHRFQTMQRNLRYELGVLL